MAKVTVDIVYTSLDGDYGEVDGIEVHCTKCDHYVEVFGQHDGSISRGCAMLNDECPRGENNFYAE